MQARGELLLSEQACGHLYGITRAAVQAVQFQNKVTYTASRRSVSRACELCMSSALLTSVISHAAHKSVSYVQQLNSGPPKAVASAV